MSEHLVLVADPSNGPKPGSICSECGAKTVEYKHGLNRGLATGLRALARAGGEARIEDLGLTKSQWQNFQKLQYWRFVQGVAVGGQRKAGMWKLTPTGQKFLDGTAAFKFAWTYRNQLMRWEGPKVTIDQVEAGYKKRPDYAREAVPHAG